MYKRILIVVEGGADARAAIREGVEVARVHGADVLFLAVLPRYVLPVSEMPVMGMVSPDEFQRAARNEAARNLAAAKVVADKAGVLSHGTMDSGVDDATCIADTASKRRCGLIVVASGGQGALMRLISGSVIPGLITHATVPVLVCRPAAGTQRARATSVSMAPAKRKPVSRKRAPRAA
jgi:nucleotide-binding universal stress UspA family protein